MKFIAIAVAMTVLTGCFNGLPPGAFDVESTAGERVIGHCTSDPNSVEVWAYGRHVKELEGATASASLVPGFRAISIKQPGYQYILYAPALEQSPPYHVVCPLNGARDSCLLSGGYSGGVVQAWVAVHSLPQLDAAAKAALAACLPHGQG